MRSIPLIVALALGATHPAISVIAAEHTHTTPAAPAISVAALATPAASGGLSPSVQRAPDGSVWLWWIERGPENSAALRVATLSAESPRWSEARTVASGRNWFVNWADVAAFALGEKGQATLVWSVNNPASASDSSAREAGHHGPGYHAVYSRSTDGGKTWTPPQPLTRESTSVEFVSLTALSDGRVLAAWLDGRAKHAHAGAKPAAQRLYARIVGSDDPDTLVDDSVCDCCPTTLTAFLDGSALVAYRARREEEVRDIRTARFDGQVWTPSRPLNSDDWRIAGCPVNGPQLASDGPRVSAAWFTAADNDPRVLASYSPDAGRRFLIPLRLDGRDSKPAGRVDTQFLRNGTMLVTWAGLDGSLWLRRINPDFTASPATPLVAASAGRSKAVMRTALVQDYAGEKSVAQLVIAYAQAEAPGETAGLRTLLVNIPEGDLLEAEKNCDCAPPSAQLAGFPMRGTIEAVQRDTAVLRVKHNDLPGLLRAGTQDFKVAPAVFSAALQPGRQFLGRIERRDGVWWLFDVRLIVSPASQSAK